MLGLNQTIVSDKILLAEQSCVEQHNQLLYHGSLGFTNLINFTAHTNFYILNFYHLLVLRPRSNFQGPYSRKVLAKS